MKAVELNELHEVSLIVASVGQCGRPLPLKKYIYLDFISKSKIEKVWEVLLNNIRELDGYGR